jgi:RNA polymerase sigma-70 factor, ECF subfamily
MPSPPTVVHLDEVRRAAHARARAGDEEDLVQGLKEGKGWAERALLERYSAHVERVLTHILGSHADLDDLAQEVFVRALERLSSLHDPAGLRSWLSAFAANVAREALRSRRRRWWQVLRPPEETPELPAPSASAEDRASLRAFYEVLGTIDPDARVAFALRYVEGMELTQVAEACGVSLATVKRRIKAAEDEFCARGRAHEALSDWFEEGTRWRQRTN